MILDCRLMKGVRHRVQGVGHGVKRDRRSDETSETGIFSRQQTASSRQKKDEVGTRRDGETEIRGQRSEVRGRRTGETRH